MRRGQSGIHALYGVNKPKGLTSHDVVGCVRRLFDERRVGHAGTLDPMAQGVLVVGVGQATRLMGLLTHDDKSYIAEICFGKETDTCDQEGSIIREAPVPKNAGDAEFAKGFLRSLIGSHEQLPPSYSAIKVDGKRAYELARAGKEIELEPRQIEILDAQLISVQTDGDVIWSFYIEVSKGTYIRSLARDIGKQLNSAAYLTGLIRMRSGSVKLDDCLDLSDFESTPKDELLLHSLDPVQALGLPVILLDSRGLESVQVGRSFDAKGLKEGTRVSMVSGDRLYGVWEAHAGSLVSVASFPDGIGGIRS